MPIIERTFSGKFSFEEVFESYLENKIEEIAEQGYNNGTSIVAPMEVTK